MDRSFFILIFAMSVTLAFSQVFAQTDSSSVQSDNQDLLLNNPDIELISATGAFLMCAGYIPWGVKILQGRMKCSSKACAVYDTKKDKNFKCLQPCG